MSVLKIEDAWGHALRRPEIEPVMKASYQPLSRGAIVYDASRLDPVTDACFDPGYWRARAQTMPVSGGRGQVHLITQAEHAWVLRHFRRGGLMGGLLQDRYLWTGLVRSRPWREWHLLYDLYRDGFPVPRPIAARVERVHRLWYRADLITEQLLAEPLSAVLRGAKAPAGLWEWVGACVRRFHRAGIYHADLNLDNILVDTEGRVFLLDFDRGRRRTPRTYWQRANLKRLYHSLVKARARHPDLAFSSDDWNRLMAAYRSEKSRA